MFERLSMQNQISEIDVENYPAGIYLIIS